MEFNTAEHMKKISRPIMERMASLKDVLSNLKNAVCPHTIPVMTSLERDDIRDGWLEKLEKEGVKDHLKKRSSCNRFLDDYSRCLLKYHASLGIVDKAELEEKRKEEERFADDFLRSMNKSEVDSLERIAKICGVDPKSRVKFTNFCHNFNRQEELIDEAQWLLYDAPAYYGCYTVACMLAEEAAMCGNDYACSTLGWCYAQGVGVQADEFEAEKWYRIAYEINEKKDPKLGLSLARILIILGRKEEAQELLDRLSESDDKDILFSVIKLRKYVNNERRSSYEKEID